ncbi:MAG: efflux RND transporter periplasmic adaptor subunit [Balneolaceae bacterium]
MNRPLIFLLLLISFFIFSCSDDQASPDGSSAISVTTAEIETRDLSDSFSVSSEVMAYTRAYVASRISGLVEEVHYEEGEAVNQGDVLAQIDVRVQKSQLRQAAAALEEARDIRERNEVLYERGAIPRAELLTSRRNLEQAESEAERLKLEIEYGTVRSPVKGVITSRLVEIGNNVSVNERMFTVTDMDLLVIRPGISEMNLTGLEVGQTVNIHLDVYPNKIFKGSIRRIFPSADPITRLFTVEVELHQTTENTVVRPGYLARVRFSSDERREVRTVPSEAVADRNGEHVLFVLNEDENSVAMVPVMIGVQRDGYAEIRDGIEAGRKVAAANLDALEDGTDVRVVGTFRRYGFRN